MTEKYAHKLLYLACPFTHSYPATQEYRYKTSCRVAAKLMKHGINVFNPLCHSVPICEFLGEIEDPHLFWMGVDLPILRRCDELLVLGLNQWTQSRGSPGRAGYRPSSRGCRSGAKTDGIEFVPKILRDLL